MTCRLARPNSANRDIEAYLEAHEHKSLLRFITCGSVDDGKSTLIGRLLYDTKMIFEDQLAALEATPKRSAPGRRHRFRAAGRRPRRPSASRASPSTSPIASSPPTSASSSSPTRPATSNTPATWRPAPRPPIWRHPDDRRPQGRADPDPPPLATSPRCSASATSCWPSTRWTSSIPEVRLRHRSSPTIKEFAKALGFKLEIHADPDLRPRATTSPPSPKMPWYTGPSADASIWKPSRSTRRRRNAAAPPSGPVGQPPQPRFPRLLRPDRVRHREAWRQGPRRRRRASSDRQSASSPQDGDLRRSRRRRIRHADARRRNRHIARRRARRRTSRRKSPTSSRQACHLDDDDPLMPGRPIS
jgi:hypothetical protein